MVDIIASLENVTFDGINSPKRVSSGFSTTDFYYYIELHFYNLASLSTYFFESFLV